MGSLVPKVRVLEDGVGPQGGRARWVVLRSLGELPMQGIKVAFMGPLSS